jgi:hypothetical protein
VEQGKVLNEASLFLGHHSILQETSVTPRAEFGNDKGVVEAVMGCPNEN